MRGPLPIIISPPFGTYFRPSWATPVLGSFTPRERPGRFWRALKTIRPVRGGWRNDIGLRNPGIGSIQEVDGRCIYSIAAFNDIEWHVAFELLSSVVGHERAVMVELNVTCPNTLQDLPEWQTYHVVQEYFDWVSVKLPCDMGRALRIAERALDAGLGVFHCTNAKRRVDGSYSGAAPREMALHLCEWVKRRWPETVVIGGGGIYTAEHARRFKDVGADHISLCTGLTRPWNIRGIRREIERGP